MEILAFAGIPITVGASEAVHRQRLYDEEAEAPERQEEFYLDVFCSANSRKRDEVDGAIVVLRDGKVRLWPQDEETKLPKKRGEDEEAPHPFTGFYLPFPPEDLPHRPIPYVPTLGLVSTIPSSSTDSSSSSPSSPSTTSNAKPKLNWIYIDRSTRDLNYGPRSEAKKHIVGPWDWTEDDEQGLTLDGVECLVAVEEEKGGFGWAVYWDEKDDRLKGLEGVGDKRVLRCSLERRLVGGKKRIKGLDED